MEKIIKKVIILSSLCVFVGLGLFVMSTDEVDGYYQRSNAISKSYSFKRWNGPNDIRLLSNGVVTVNHKVDMRQGSYQMCKNEPLSFSYSDEFTFTASNGIWDTPNAAWCSHINDRCRSIYKGQKIYDSFSANWWMSKQRKSGYSWDDWWDIGVRDNRINEGWILWTGVKHTAPGQPYSYITSSNSRVVSCNGMSCRAVGDGRATLTAYAKRAEARIWALIEFQNPRNNWKWSSEDDPYLNGSRVNRMWMSSGHTRIGSWTVTVGNAARCSYCGDGKITNPEQCDTSAGSPSNCTAGYNQSCQYCVPGQCILKTKTGPYCGDGIRNGAEQCDNGGLNGRPCSASYDGTCTYCSNSCTNTIQRGPYCGDGLLNGTEQCDDGNTNNNDSCSNSCLRQCACESLLIGQALPYFQTAWDPGTVFCQYGDTAEPLFPQNEGGSAKWTCESTSAFPCAGSESCSVQRGTPPECSCGSLDGTVIEDTPSGGGLCGVGNPSPISDSDGVWNWDCGPDHTAEDPRGYCTNTDSCSAECVRINIDAPEFVYLKKNNNKIKVKVRIDGHQNVRGGVCEITANGKTLSKTVEVNASGGSTREVQFDDLDFTGPSTTVTAQCDLNVDCSRLNYTSKKFIASDRTVRAVCTERSCNSQGTCQSTPKSGVASVDDCTSTCSSNADCSRGRMIETRP